MYIEGKAQPPGKMAPNVPTLVEERGLPFTEGTLAKHTKMNKKPTVSLNPAIPPHANLSTKFALVNLKYIFIHMRGNVKNARATVIWYKLHEGTEKSLLADSGFSLLKRDK